MAAPSVLADIAAARVIGKGPDGYREALEFLAEQRVSERIERLRPSLEEPLLVASGPTSATSSGSRARTRRW